MCFVSVLFLSLSFFLSFLFFVFVFVLFCIFVLKNKGLVHDFCAFVKLCTQLCSQEVAKHDRCIRVTRGDY